MRYPREYLVALDVRSTLHAWIAAASEYDARRTAQHNFDTEGKSAFSIESGAIESVIVLECRTTAPRARKRFAVAFKQPVVHRIIVEADDIDDALARGTRAYLGAPNFFPNDPPNGWGRTFGNWDIVRAEEVQP